MFLPEFFYEELFFSQKLLSDFFLDFRSFEKKFSKALSQLHSTCPEEHIAGNRFRMKTTILHLCRAFEGKLSGFFFKILARSSKLNSISPAKLFRVLKTYFQT